jgi:predicted acyl esterase
VSSDAGNGQGQFHVSLAEVSAQGEVTEFARNRRGTVDLGTTPAPIELALTVSSHRIDPGNRLMLTITASDAAEVIPFVSPNAIFVHHDSTNPSLVVVPTVSIDREQPTGSVPSGAGFTEDPLGTICEAFGQDCGQ